MSPTTITKPTLTAAQIMADLDSLNKCDPPAATALLNASKNLCPTQIRRRSKASTLPDPPKFDKLGKRIVIPPPSRLNSDVASPSRTQRNGVSPGANGINDKKDGTEVQNPLEKDDDMRRAKELVELFEKKDYFTYMGTTGLGKSKKRVDEVVQRYAQKDLEARQRVAHARQLGVR